MEDNTFGKDLKESMELQRKYNRKEFRRFFGTSKTGNRSMAPRHVAPRKPVPMPENWQGWKNWKPKKKVV